MYLEIQSSRIMCKKDYPFYIELPLILFRKSFRHICVGPFLSTRLGPIGLCVYTFAGTTPSSLLWFYVR